MRKQKHNSRRLAALIAGALLFSRGALTLPIVSAQNTTISDTSSPGTGNDAYGNHDGTKWTGTADNSITMTGEDVNNIYGAKVADFGTKHNNVAIKVIDATIFQLNNITESMAAVTNNTVTISGSGSYDSYLEDAAGTHGEGKAHYFGIGLMARQVNHDGLSYEGSLRGGSVQLGATWKF